LLLLVVSGDAGPALPLTGLPDTKHGTVMVPCFRPPEKTTGASTSPQQPVMPAKAGIQLSFAQSWTPAFAGVTPLYGRGSRASASRKLTMPWLDHGILFLAAEEDPGIKSGVIRRGSVQGEVAASLTLDGAAARRLTASLRAAISAFIASSSAFAAASSRPCFWYSLSSRLGSVS
jgi:hypothetical protein